MTNNSTIAIFTHTQYKDGVPIYGPPDNVRDYLRNYYKGDVLYLQHSLYKGDGSILNLYKNGAAEVICRYDFHKNWPNVLRYVIDLFFSIILFLNSRKIPVIIAVDPLNFLYAFLLKKTGRVKKIVFYTLDYGYKRFNNPILNKIYHSLDRFAARRSDESWNACKKIADVRREQGVLESRNIHIPNSPIFHGVTVQSLNEINRFSLVCVFSNYLQVDFKIIFDAMEVLLGEFPEVRLKLIGRGDFKGSVEGLASNKKILKNIEFLDIHSHTEALNEVSRCAIGLECNTQTLGWNEFREPIKIREYMAFGLPIISKPGHSLVDEIVNEGIGFIIHNKDEFIKAVRTFFSDADYYSKVRVKILEIGKKYDKKRILDEVLGRLTG
jgi:glycosyltransferase involved in cell wall biosynthesis